MKRLSILLLLMLCGCMPYMEITDTRTGQVYAKRGPMVTWAEGDPVEFHDEIRNEKVRLDAWKAQKVSKATYDDLLYRGAER